MPNDDQYDLRAEFVRTLMQKVEQDPYPSSTMLDLIEQNLTSDELPAYASALLERVQSDTFPSIPMLKRIQDLA